MVKKVLGRKHHSSGKIGNSWNSNKIHWVKDSSSCKHCDRHRLLLAKEELLCKTDFEAGKHPNGIFLLEDFTQLNTAKGGFFQDLIIVWYSWDAEKEEQICYRLLG